MARNAPRRPGRPRNPVPRARLLAIARQAFAELGYSGASMSAIATRAGIRKPSLFHHFPTKEGLYVEAVGAALAPMGALVELAAGGDHGFLVRLDRLGELVTDYLGAHPEAARLLVREVLDSGPFLSAPSQPAGVVLDAVRAFLEAGMDAGEFARADARHLALSIVALHLFYFAADPLSGAQIEGSVFDEEQIASRRAAVVGQVRTLVTGS